MVPPVDDPDLVSCGEKLLRDPGAKKAGTAEEKNAHP
jgi:hypothetical protein